MRAGALLKTVDTVAGEERSVLQSIEHAATATNRLIRDLLDLFSIQAGSLVLDLRNEVPGALSTEAAEAFADLAEQRCVTLEVKSDPNLPIIRADARRLHQAMSNLLTNAVLVTGSGGRITLRSERENGEVRFVVEHGGADTPTVDLDHIIDGCWQSGAGDSSQLLKLAIVQGIVEAHGGHLAVRGTPGKGSEFHFTIPVASEDHITATGDSRLDEVTLQSRDRKPGRDKL